MAETKAFVKQRGGKRGVAIVRARHPLTTSAASAARVSAGKPLTDQQKAFVRYWAQGDSKSNAARRAGYADDKFVYRLIRMPNVLALKAKYEAKYEADAQMDRKQVLAGLKESIDMAKLMAEPMTMIAGWREIGKMCGYYAPVETKLKVDVNGNITMRTLTAMTDAELLEMIEQGAEAPEDPDDSP